MEKANLIQSFYRLVRKPFTDKQKKHFVAFQENLNNGVEYYKELFQKHKAQLEDSTSKNNMMQDLEKMNVELIALKDKML